MRSLMVEKLIEKFNVEYEFTIVFTALEQKKN